MKLSEAQYEPTMYSDIDGWAEDDHDAALRLLPQQLQGDPAQECRRARRPADAGALQKICRKVRTSTPSKPGAARAFFENNFSPVKIAPLGTPDGFLTGYYEPIVEGVTEPTKGYDCPLYRKPASLADRRQDGGRRRRASARRRRARKGSWRFTIAPRSTTACSPAAIWKSAG